MAIPHRIRALFVCGPTHGTRRISAVPVGLSRYLRKSTSSTHYSAIIPSPTPQINTQSKKEKTYCFMIRVLTHETQRYWRPTEKSSRIRMSKDKARTKDLCQSMMTVYDPRVLTGVRTVDPGVDEVLQMILEPTIAVSQVCVGQGFGHDTCGTRVVILHVI